MRIGEFLALGIDDIDFEKNQIRINKTYNWKLKYISPPKTETSVRTITMPKSVMKSLRSFVNQYYEIPERIFSLTSQKILTARLEKYADKAGVHRIRLHDLRHSHASLLIHKNDPVTAIAQRLGHKNAKITLEVYSHVYKASDGAIAKVLEKL